GIMAGSGFPRLPGSLRGQDTKASMLFAVIVDPAGRIEPASRTLVASTGDPRVIKAWCDFLITARIDWKGRTPRRTVALLPIMFFTASAPAGQTPKAPIQKGFYPEPVIAML